MLSPHEIAYACTLALFCVMPCMVDRCPVAAVAAIVPHPNAVVIDLECVFSPDGADIVVLQEDGRHLALAPPPPPHPHCPSSLPSVGCWSCVPFDRTVCGLRQSSW
jgi:hypothetical protein